MPEPMPQPAREPVRREQRALKVFLAFIYFAFVFLLATALSTIDGAGPVLATLFLIGGIVVFFSVRKGAKRPSTSPGLVSVVSPPVGQADSAPGVVAPLVAPPAAALAPTTSAPAHSVGQGWQDVEVAGESYHRSEIGRLFRKWGLKAGGVTMRVAVLVPEPTNKHDRNAVKVVIDGEHVGYVPAEDAPRVRRAIAKLPKKVAATVPVRIWGTNGDGTWRTRITLAFSGATERERDFWAETVAEREREATAAAVANVGQVRGAWWATHREAIGELKKQERYPEALSLIEECAAAVLRVAAVENKAPNAWPAEQASIVLRKMKDPVRELAILESYVQGCGEHPVSDRMLERLNRARVAAQG